MSSWQLAYHNVILSIWRKKELEFSIIINNICICIQFINVRFQSIGTTSDFGTKFAQNNMNDKNFEKVNTEFEIRT